ncbi:hypothetical protein B0I35DRAFT_192710 [Stachybotrys elegans]|uniref:RRM domain-containing protein n=1 Tax=Stachybotrys elegans TaxID=80388 RepID=A0A8K0T0I6_9HYPO|nr:hypothetical protein B0I35DRAFT_192710 [Stachybotrys elegans]
MEGLMEGLMEGFYVHRLQSLCRQRGWDEPSYEFDMHRSGFTCRVRVNGREYPSNSAHDSHLLAQEQAAIVAYLVVHHFSVNTGAQGLPAEGEGTRRNKRHSHNAYKNTTNSGSCDEDSGEGSHGPESTSRQDKGAGQDRHSAKAEKAIASLATIEYIKGELRRFEPEETAHLKHSSHEHDSILRAKTDNTETETDIFHAHPGQEKDALHPPCNTLYVSNLPIDTSEEDLVALFSMQHGYERLCFRTKANGPTCLVEFKSTLLAAKTLYKLDGYQLANNTRDTMDGMRLRFSRNPLGVRSDLWLQAPAQRQDPGTGYIPIFGQSPFDSVSLSDRVVAESISDFSISEWGGGR